MAEITVTLDEERTLVYNNKCLYKMEQKLGKTLAGMTTSELSSVDVVITVIWAGMMEKYNMPWSEVLDIVPLDDRMKFTPDVFECVGQALGWNVKSDGKAKKEKAASSVG